ncbi:MAG: Asp-tRNA(Asn)/Glu-tRNA(Gln) amidotransferase subunit GatB, partial [Alphaproteobacteria bacterium]|nr:Asp-tRNA(Asn)/Glu-tRNA(Gln) amidotransferase subunit GatB [Alphaproteobacteria bacterium]
KHPIVGEGVLTIELSDGSSHLIGIERLHLEQDAGKSLHDQHPSKSYIDLNRSGVALMEIVSKPDLRSAEQAGAYIKKLRSILRYLGTCDGNMEEGSLRADVNVSVRKPGAPLGTRTETKNLNSVRFIMQTIDAEVERQIEVIEDGGEIFQETRLFDTSTGMTRAMRSKEDAHDYRYFPDPDLLPLSVTQDYVDEIAAELPELPDDIRMRMVDEYGLSSYDAGVLTEERETALFYETASAGRDRKIVANWMSVELFGALNKAGKILAESPVSPAALGELVDLITQGTISGRIAKDVFAEMFETGEAAASIIESKGLKQVSDTGAIEALIDKVIAENQDKVDEYRGGKDKLFGFFVGQTMKLSGGQANPGMVNQLLKDKLE